MAVQDQTMTREEQATREGQDVDALVAGFKSGEPGAFAALYSRHFDQVYAYLRIVLHNPHEVEDAVQQVFVQALEALPRYERRPNHTFQAWLFTIVRNHALDELRRLGRIEVTEPAEVDRRRERAAEVSATTGIDALTWLTDGDIVLFLERLPLPQRQVLALRFMMDLSVAETAAILDRTPGDVGILQHRALKFLKARLTSIGREPKKTSTGDRDAMTTYTKFARVLRNRRYALK